MTPGADRGRLLRRASAELAGTGLLVATVVGSVNPVFALTEDWWLGRRTGAGLAARELAAYLVAQIVAPGRLEEARA